MVGWFWLREEKKTNALLLIALLALSDEEDRIRVAALKVLSAARKLPSAKIVSRHAFLAELLRSESQSVVSAALEYAGRVGALEDLSLINESTPPGIAARIMILLRHDPRKAFDNAIRLKPLPSEVVRSINAKLANLSNELILRGLHSADPSLRVASIDELSRRMILGEEHMYRGLEDPDLRVRKRGYELLIAKGKRFDLEELREKLKDEESKRLSFLGGGRERVRSGEVILLQLREFTEEQLVSLISWYALSAPLAYQVLAEDHFDHFGSMVRTDLESGFARIYDEWVGEIRAQYGVSDELAQSVLEKSDKVNDFVRSKFAVAALLGLAKNGVKEDRALIKKFLNSGDVFTVVAATAALISVGNKDDVNDLLAIAAVPGGLAKKRAAAAALRLDPSVGMRLISSNDPDLVGLVLASMPWNSRKNRSMIRSLLLSDNSMIRSKAVAFLLMNASRGYLDRLLVDYVKEIHYYYDVVSGIDRFLYAPKALRSSREALEAKLAESYSVEISLADLIT